MLTSLVLAIVLPLYTFAAGFVGIPYTLVTGDSRPLYWLGRLGVRIGFTLARIRIVRAAGKRGCLEPQKATA